jgi:hypothetical protein
MSSSIGGLISMNPGAVGNFFVKSNNPGWKGIYLWTPQPMSTGIFSYEFSRVVLNGDGTYSFWQKITNLGGVPITFQIEYTVL